MRATSPPHAQQRENAAAVALQLPHGDSLAMQKLALDRLDTLLHHVAGQMACAPGEPGLSDMMAHLQGAEPLSKRHAEIEAMPPAVAEEALNSWNLELYAFLRETHTLTRAVRPHVWERILSATDVQVGEPKWCTEDLFCLARLLARCPIETSLKHAATTVVRAVQRVADARCEARSRLVFKNQESCDYTDEEREQLTLFTHDPVVQQSLRIHQTREVTCVSMVGEATEKRIRRDPALSCVVAMFENIWTNHYAANEQHRAKRAGQLSYAAMREKLVAIAAENLLLADAAREALTAEGWDPVEIETIHRAVLNNPLKRIKPSVISGLNTPDCLRFELPEDLLARAQDLEAQAQACEAASPSEKRDFSTLTHTARALCVEATADNVLTQTLSWLTLSSSNNGLRALGEGLDEAERRLKALAKRGRRPGTASKKGKTGPRKFSDGARPVAAADAKPAKVATAPAPDAKPASVASAPAPAAHKPPRAVPAPPPPIAPSTDQELTTFVESNMSAGTFGSRWDSAVYHYKKHGVSSSGAPPSMKAWLAEALAMRQHWDGHTVTRSFVDPSVLLRIVDNAATYLVFTEQGRIVSYRNRLSAP